MIYRRKRSRLRTNRYVVHVVVSLLQSTLYINVYRKNYSFGLKILKNLSNRCSLLTVDHAIFYLCVRKHLPKHTRVHFSIMHEV